MKKHFLYLTLVLGLMGFSLNVRAEESGESQELFNHYELDCESYNYNYNQCALPGYIINAWVVYEYSMNACIPNHAWGISGNVVWVNRGCRARFRVVLEDRRPPPPPPRRVIDIACESRDFGYQSCYLGPRVVQLSMLRQMSKNECYYGQSWGYTDRTVWVDRGCRALFRAVIDPY